MTTTVNSRFRQGSASRRTAILDAAQGLFLAEGFERAKMDTIASEAGVSKRTVYDYYGDKQALFTAVVERVIRALEAAVQSALENELSTPEDLLDLETSLVRFARSISVSALGSSEYSVLSRLFALEAPDSSDVQGLWSGADPEEALAARFAEFDRQGLLTAPNPRRAADHFVALTLAPTTAGTGLRRAVAPTDSEIEDIILDGVRAFLRAYAAER